MLRSTIVAAALLAVGAVSAHAQSGLTTQQLASPWPGGAGARDSSPTVSARAAGFATGTASYRARVTLERRGVTRAEAEAAIDRAIAEVVAIGGVEVRLNRRDVATIAAERPDAPARFTEHATIEVEARTRKAITDWTSKLPAGGPVTAQTPILFEQMNDGDPAWDLAARNAMAAADRDARIAADATGGQLGRLVGVWVERVGVLDGAAHVLVTVEYLIARRR